MTHVTKIEPFLTLTDLKGSSSKRLQIVGYGYTYIYIIYFGYSVSLLPFFPSYVENVREFASAVPSLEPSSALYALYAPLIPPLFQVLVEINTVLSNKRTTLQPLWNEETLSS